MIRLCIKRKEKINVLVQSHFNKKKKERKGQQDNKSLFTGEV